MGLLIRLALSVLVLATGAAAEAEPSAVPGPGGFRFPVAVGDLRRGEVHNYDEHEAGVGIDYRASEHLKITLYVYPATGPCESSLEAEFRCSLDAIRVRPGAQIMGSASAMLALAGGRVPAIVGAARLLESSGVYDSFLVVAPAGAQVVKVRATYKSGELAFAAVMDRVGKLLAAASESITPRPAWASGVMPIREALDVIDQSPGSRNLYPLFGFIQDFAERSPEVKIVLDLAYLPMDGSEECNAIFLGLYVAGAVRFDLDHPSRAGESSADVIPGLESVLRHLNKPGGPACSTPFVQRIQDLARQGRLSTLLDAGAARPTE